MGDVVNEDTNKCVDATASTWEILTDNTWQADSTAKVSCDGNTDTCCSGLSITSTGGIASTYPDLLGTYQQDFTASGDHPAYLGKLGSNW
jgi:hypothetical protein